jgi:hypothetical protein
MNKKVKLDKTRAFFKLFWKKFLAEIGEHCSAF